MRVLLAALAATLVLSLAVGSAAARRIEVSNQGIRIVWTLLSFNAGENIHIRCPVTLEGTLHSRTISKISGQLIGYITRAIVGRRETCEGGQATVLTATLPWHIQYLSFAGTLPNITSVSLALINASFLVEPGLGITCLARTSQANPAKGIAAISGGVFTTLTAEEGAAIPLTGSFCPPTGTFTGAGNITLLGNTTRITVRLVQ